MKTTPTTAPAKPDQARRVALAVATWFGCGYAPLAPGTWGSAGALVPALLLVRAGWEPWHFLLLAIIALPAAIWAADAAERYTGRKDPGLVVVDEVVGQWVTLAGATTLNWKSWLAAFVLFRLMDIFKPPPVRQLERLPGGTGIVADDVMAGLYGAAVLWVAGHFGLY
jgi:phosphatidylglycerophosphatase A